MKRIVASALTFIMLAVFASCAQISGDISQYKVEEMSSEIYSAEDLDAAVRVIAKHFYEEFGGSTLYTINYLGDEYCGEDLEYCNSLNDENAYTEAARFEISFRTSDKSGVVWSHNTVYDNFKIFLARENGGEWVVVTGGYG